MSKRLREWIETDVKQVSSKPLRWLSDQYFFRDPSRPIFSNADFFYPPADGIILYAKKVTPDESIVDIKGKPYSLNTAMRDKDYDRESLVIGIFMTFYDVHINRIPYAGRLSYKELEPISSYNYPMLNVEKDIVNDIVPYTELLNSLVNGNWE